MTRDFFNNFQERVTRRTRINLSITATMEDWTNLSYHLLDLIFEKLTSLVDQLQFSTSCVSWHNYASERNPNKLISSLLPMLLLRNDDTVEDESKLYDVTRNKLLLRTQQIVPEEFLHLSGSSKGWLASVNHDSTVTLYKCFFSNIESCVAQTIYLPSVFAPELDHEEIIDESHIHMVSLSSDPLVDPSNCTIAAIFGEIHRLTFIRLGKDTSWTEISGYDSICVDNVLYHNDKFYAVIHNGTIISFDVPESGDPTVRVVLRRSVLSSHKKYLVTSPRGELWYIEKRYKFHDLSNGESDVIMFRIFRLDGIESDDAKLVEIENIGPVALFLGKSSSISILASNGVGCKANTIYFTHDIDMWSQFDTSPTYDFGEYDVENRCSFTVRLLSSGEAIWVIPSIMNL